MGNTNEKADTRSTQEKSEFNLISGGSGTAGDEGTIYGYEQKRINRENSSQPSIILISGGSTLGGTLRQLIDEYCSQLVLKQEKVQRLKEEIVREEADIDRFSYRIKEFKNLLADIEQPESA